MYNHEDKSKATLKECSDAVGKRATLPLTGTIVGVYETPGVGVYVKMEIDERWGFGKMVIGADLESMEIEED